MEAGTIMFEFDQEIHRPKVEDLTKSSQIHKGNALCKRKTINQLLKDEEKRLILPDIITTTKTQNGVVSKRGRIKKGYTFPRSNFTERDKNSLNEDGIEKVLLLTSLEPNSEVDNNNYNKLHSKQCLQTREKPLESEHVEKIKPATRNGQVGHSDESTSNEQLSDQQEIFKGPNKTRTTSEHKALVRRSERIDIGASMCTQSFSSLCTELTMFKDAFKATAAQMPPSKLLHQQEAQLNPPSSSSRSSRSSSVQSPGELTFALFRNQRRRSLLSRSQESRRSSIRRSSTQLPTNTPSRIPSDEQLQREVTGGTCNLDKKITGRKESNASEATNECCLCVTRPHVHFRLKDRAVNNIEEETDSPRPDYGCYAPKQLKLNKVQMELPKTADNPKRALSLPRIPFKPAVVETYLVKNADTPHSALSDPEVSLRKRTKIDRTSHEWPEDKTLKSTSPPTRQALMNHKCNEWLDRWV